MTFQEVGSRGYEVINFKDTCILSGVENTLPLHSFNRNLIIVRSDLVEYCFAFLSYKFGLVSPCDIALIWSRDEWKYHSNKIYRERVTDDLKMVQKVLAEFGKNFLKSDAEKITY